MPQSLSLVLLHVIFSTKDRVPLIKPTLRPKLHAYLATVTRNLDCECFLVGGIDDHVHLAIGLSRTITLAKLVEQIKTSSLKIPQNGRSKLRLATRLRRLLRQPRRPPRPQAIHRHPGTTPPETTFQDELRDLLLTNNIPFDERYLWD